MMLQDEKMSKQGTQICTVCWTSNPSSRGTCLKCGGLLEPDDDILKAKLTPSTTKIVSAPFLPVDDLESDHSFNETTPAHSDEHPSSTVKDSGSSSSDQGALRSSPLPPPGPQPRYRNPRWNALRSINERRTLMLMIIGGLLVTILLFVTVSQLLQPVSSNSQLTPTSNPTATSNTALPYPIYPQAIGVYPDEDGENIGLSDGSYALDVEKDKQDIEKYRPGSNYKIQASEALRKGDTGRATALWSQARNEDSNDAETLIYLEDQRVLASGKPYVTIVIGSVLADKPVDYSSRDQLQGAYIAQLEHNEEVRTSSSGDLLLRLLIAKSGNTTINSVKVTNQILEAAHSDKTIVGVLGWTKTTNSLNVLPIFAQAHIPMLSSSALGDDLTGRSPYFFRIVPRNKELESALAKYTASKLKFQKLVVVYEGQDPFSQNEVDDFTQQFVADGHDNPPRLPYQRLSSPEKMKDIVNSALQTKPDAILLAGSRSTDIGNFLAAIPADSNVKILTDSAEYPLADAPPGDFKNTSRLIFASPAFPDEWKVIKPSEHEQPFFIEYKTAFDPYNQHGSTPYGYQRPDTAVMQAYDAILVLVKGLRIARTTHNESLTGDDLQQALLKIKGAQAVQGIAGQISFGDDRDPVKKEILVLQDDGSGLQLKYYQGCFLVGDQDCGGHFVE